MTSDVPRTCSICDKPHRSKGYCQPHYYRLGKHGDPLGGRTPPGELLRFIHEVAVNHTGNECLTWPFSKIGKGYGKINVGGKSIIVSRYICELVNGPPPTPDHEAAHSCGKGHEACISPLHMSWKTKAENAADRLIHGTHTRGERNAQAKLTEAAAREILSLRGKETPRDLAQRFSVSLATVAQIHTGRNWAWLNQEHRP